MTPLPQTFRVRQLFDAPSVEDVPTEVDAQLARLRLGEKIRPGQSVAITFVPHLVPMIRGIHATVYALPRQPIEDIQGLYEKRYADELFVDVMPAGSHPDTRSVRISNTCRIAVHHPESQGRIVVLAVIDNLVKGAAGQAVQNMNLMFDLKEDSGLAAPAMLP